MVTKFQRGDRVFSKASPDFVWHGGKSGWITFVMKNSVCVEFDEPCEYMSWFFYFDASYDEYEGIRALELVNSPW